jgi:predicted transcriptional regulator of viral defense system
MKHEAFFRQHPVFTTKEFEIYLLSLGITSKKTEESLLNYYKKSGRLISIKRGLYAVAPFGVKKEKFIPDPFLITAKISKDSVISHHTALEFYGYAYSTWQTFFYTSSLPKLYRFKNFVFKGLKTPEALHKLNMEDFEVTVKDRAGINICITSIERTLVDVLNKPEISGGWEEIWRSLESVEFYNVDKIIEYVRLLNNSTLAAKVGFFLEQHKEQFMVDERHLDILCKLKPKQPHYMDKNKNKPCKLISKWNLIVPIEIIERGWAEVV